MHKKLSPEYCDKPDVNALVDAAVSFKNEKTCIFKKLISQRHCHKVPFLNMLPKERVIQNHLLFKEKTGSLTAKIKLTVEKFADPRKPSKLLPNHPYRKG